MLRLRLRDEQSMTPAQIVAATIAMQASASAGIRTSQVASKKAAAVNDYYARLVKSGELKLVFPGSRNTEATWDGW